MRKDETLRRYFSRHSSQLLLFVILLLLCLYLDYRSEFFFSGKNIKNILEALSFRLILALGMSFVIASGAVDLSAGSIVSLCGVLMAICLQSGAAVPVAIVVGLAAGAALGAANGAIIHISGVNSLIITLGTASLYRGMALILTKGIPITKFPASFLFWGRSDVDKLNPQLVIALALLMLSIPLLHRVKWGQYVQGLGGNAEALRRMGVSCGLYRVTAHLALGLAAAVVALIITARLNSAEANAGLSMEMDAITAVIMGGTPLSGGRASIAGTTVAVLLLGVIRNGLTILSISSYYQQFIIGALLLLSIIFSELRRRKAGS